MEQLPNGMTEIKFKINCILSDAVKKIEEIKNDSRKGIDLEFVKWSQRYTGFAKDGFAKTEIHFGFHNKLKITLSCVGECDETLNQLMHRKYVGGASAYGTLQIHVYGNEIEQLQQIDGIDFNPSSITLNDSINL